jgi:DNA invertase Pin-like site-specific DNA recombinase
VLSAVKAAEEPLTAAHRAKLAYIYVRQSSVHQVRQHQESTELQYRLVDRAVGLGWPRERVHIIDEDLGRSGAASAERHGFQRLIAEIGLGNAGLVLSLDASRLARNNRDWHQLLELCSLFGVILADGERLYDPTAYHDRLLLGLSGIMSEAELHQIKLRLHQGERQKAARGELRLPLPAGLSQGRGGDIVLNPDEEVQERLRLVFAKFAELQSARAVMRYLRAHDLPLPVRPLLGPAPHEVLWREANSARVRYILQNPAYAGAYVYGRRRPDPVRRRSGARAATTKVAVGAWEVCLPAAFPGYIPWEEFMANQRRLADNVNRYAAGHRGVPRRGRALLQGIAACGRCGRRMSLRYTGPNGDYPVYCCRADRDQAAAPLCQEVRALPVDAFVERTLLEAWRRTGSRSPSRRSGSCRRKCASSKSNGAYGASVPATKPSGRVASTMRSSRRTAWWPDPWSISGRRSCAPSKRSSRRTNGGAARSRSCWARPTMPSCKGWARTCRGCGMR